MNEQHLDNIVDEAIDLLSQGKSIDEIVRLFPAYDADLRELLGVSEQLVDEVTVPQEALSTIVASLDETPVSQQSLIHRFFSFHLFSMNRYLTPSLATLAIVLVLGTGLYIQESRTGIDDWQFSLADTEESTTGGFVSRVASQLKHSASNVAAPAGDTFGLSVASPVKEFRGGGAAANSESALGFSVGGSKDIQNFRENIEQGYLPLPTDITVEGLYYDYYFDTGKTKACDTLFCPSYSTAVSSHPLTGEDEYYLSVGLNSGMTERDFARKKLNIVVVLDISGSMNTSFDQYYYDQHGNYIENKKLSRARKIDVAKDAINGLTKHLGDDDRFGMVLFDDSSYLAKPLSSVGETDMRTIRNHISEIETAGGTNMSAGIAEATELFEPYLDSDSDEYEHRIIFLTDAMPNAGDYSAQGLLGMTSQNADNKLHTTFIGIGVDFQTELIERITKIRGANYYSVHNADEFETRMVDEFDFMVTPLVFDLALEVDSDSWEIDAVYGSPEADQATGQIMHVNTLFPSRTNDGDTKGGLVLLKMKRTGGNDDIRINARYETRTGERASSAETVVFDNTDVHYDHSGIRKGVVLARYATLLQEWTQFERSDEINPVDSHDDWILERKEIAIPEPYPVEDTWERSSLPLQLSSRYARLFERFVLHLEKEIDIIDDDTLEQEVTLIEHILQNG